MIEYVIDGFVWFVNSGLISGVITISVTVGIVKLVHHLFKGVTHNA